MKRNARQVPRRPEAWDALDIDDLSRDAAAHYRAGRLGDAEKSCLRLLRRYPGHPATLHRLGIILSERGDNATSIQHLTAALRAEPGKGSYWISLASALLQTDRTAEACALLTHFQERAFNDGETNALKTALVEVAYGIACRHFCAERFVEAEAVLNVVILLHDRHADAVHLLGLLATKTKRLEAAVEFFEIAISIDDQKSEYYTNLGQALYNQNQIDRAIKCFELAMGLGWECAVTYSNLGVALQTQDRQQEAIDNLEKSIALDPNYAKAYNNLGVVYHDLGRLAEAVACYDRALAIDGNFVAAYHNRMFTRMHDFDVSIERQYEEAIHFGRTFADPLLRLRSFGNSLDENRKIRIGFVSGDFRKHAVTFFFEPTLTHFDRARFELYGFSNTPIEDDFTGRLRGEFDHWRNIRDLGDDEAADLIENDGIDILVDLSGHTANNRLLVFARKPAPVQVSWLGYPGTTGMQAIDYRLTCGFSEPAGSNEATNSEIVWRLPGVQASYQPPLLAHPVTERAPFETNGYVTFGCTNRMSKLNDETLETWAEILHRLPFSKLLLVIPGGNDLQRRDDYIAKLSTLGFPVERVIFEPRRLQENYYQIYNRIDILLDPFPYNGGTTSLDSLWMGVPFVTLEGDRFVSRVGHGILNAMGLAELSTGTRDKYIEVACRLANDQERLCGIRHDLRGRMVRGPYLAYGTLAAQVGDAFASMWGEWIRAQKAIRIPPPQDNFLETCL